MMDSLDLALVQIYLTVFLPTVSNTLVDLFSCGWRPHLGAEEETSTRRGENSGWFPRCFASVDPFRP